MAMVGVLVGKFCQFDGKLRWGGGVYGHGGVSRWQHLQICRQATVGCGVVTPLHLGKKNLLQKWGVYGHERVFFGKILLVPAIKGLYAHFFGEFALNTTPPPTLLATVMAVVPQK